MLIMPPELSVFKLLGLRRDIVLVIFAHAMLVLVGMWFFAEYRSENRARQLLLGATATASNVLINGRPIEDPEVILAALRQIHHIPSHHSSPVDPIRFTLKAGGITTAVILARDSEVPNEFWVYRPGPNWHNDPLGQAAGRITSTELNNLLRKSGL
jgi:hypothetical protein